MAQQVKLDRNTLAAGEVSPAVYAQDDLARQRAGCKKLENFVVLVEGGATRLPGTRFADPLKAEDENAKIVDFRFRRIDTYKLLMNGGAMRVYRNGGVVLDSGDPYELAIPWASADLPNLRWTRDLDTMFFACRGHRPRDIKRIDHDDWTIEAHPNVGGPVKEQNLDENIKIGASSVSGQVALSANSPVFEAGHVGGVWRLDEPDLVSVALWKPNETITSDGAPITGGVDHVGNMTQNGGLAAAFDGQTSETFANSAVAGVIGWVGRDYGSSPKKVQYAKVYGSTDQGFRTNSNSAVTLRLYGKNGSAPSAHNNGTLLGQITFTDTNDESAGRQIDSANATTAWRYVWVSIHFDGSSGSFGIAEIVPYEPLSTGLSGIQRRYNGRVYQALSNGSSGVNPPEHDDGDAKTGGGEITWRFLHNGYGFVRIDSVADSQSATATVLSRLPDSVVEGATHRFWPSAWDDVEGWPEKVAQSDGRLWWFRGDEFWASRPRDFWNHEFDDTDESAISGRLRSESGEAVNIAWALAAGVLVCGTPDLEWLLRSSTSTAALTAKNIKPVNDTSEGSADHIPAQAEGGVLFIGPSRERLHYAKFDRGVTDKLATSEVTLTARHILEPRAVNLTFQRDPNKILFIHCEDGSLVGMTFMPKEKVEGFHRHPKPGAKVLDSCTTPDANGIHDETMFVVEREIDGESRRYVEFLAPYFRPLDRDNPTAEGAWFLDCALKYTGAPVTNVAGLDHLEGETVGVFSAGRDIGDRVVTGGTLDEAIPASGDILVGLRMPRKMHSLSFDPPTQSGSSKSKKKQANHILLELTHSYGGTAQVNDGAEEAIDYAEVMDVPASGPMPLFTGRVPLTLESPTGLECEIVVAGDDAYPFTISGYGPDLDVTEAG